MQKESLIAQKNMAIMGLILGAISPLTAMFPICGLPIAVAALVINMRMRHTQRYYRLASWGLALACIGLLLTLISLAITTGIYINSLLWNN